MTGISIEVTGLGAVPVGINDSTTKQEQLLGFNVLILDSATVAIALESVTATVIDLYVYWKPGFRIKLEASLAANLSVGRDGSGLGSSVGFKDLTAWQRRQMTQEQVLVFGFNVLVLDSAVIRERS